MKKASMVLLSFILGVCSCGESEFEYSGHKAYFIYDNSQHLDPTLSSAMNSLAPGIFCRISTPTAGYVTFENNQGMTSRTAMTAIEEKRTSVLGLYNGSGVIVGFGTLSQPSTFYAYDAQCPNCYKETNIPRYQLSMNPIGVASCGRCSRTYDMNNGGIVSTGPGGDKLIRYRASTTGPNGLLSINN